ncbi:MAG: DPP IV N-terminal domain-containing protein, partial [Saprospiraceae bacterium]|nr:DPP IV N-terminal domain-containing protein [Saprospiraceae bacterium]
MKWLKVILLISLVNIGYGQRIITEDRLTLDRIFDSRDFVPDWLPPYKWLAGGSYFTTIEYNEKGNSELISYRSETGEKNTLISDQLLRTSSGQPIVIEDYYWSADEKKILIFTNSERVWRTNTRGDYYVLNLESKQIYQLGEGLPLSSLMFAKFNPQGTMVAYVSQHNLYQENLETREIQQLTTDGSEGIINGTFDWAYEEEFFCKDGFRWSPDGNSIAYWQIDANETKNFYLINNTSSIYSQVIPIQYPKVGQKPSSAKIGILDIPSKTTQWIDLPGEPYEHYLPRMQWLTPTNTLLITQLSRKQNHLTLWTVDRTSMTPDKVYEEESDTWIDIVNIDVSAAWEVEDQVSLDQGNSFLWMSDKDGWRHLYRINVKDKQVELLSTGAFDIASVKGINTKENLIYVIASPDNSTQRYLYAINTTNKSYERITPTNYSGLNNYDISPNGNFAVFEHDQSNDPGQTFFISLPDHLLKDTLITNDHFRKSLDAIKLPEVEFFKITTEDGVEMDGKMIKPLNFSKSKKYPVLFYVY